MESLGEVFAVFDARTQDSGNVSFGVQQGDQRWFAKSAGDPKIDVVGSTFVERVERLRNAIVVSESAQHATRPRLQQLIECADGPLLISEWVQGELIRVPSSERANPAGPFARFRALPPKEIELALDALFDLHLQLAAAGWIAEDFYDGCLIYDFAQMRLHVIDLDGYHHGPITNTTGRRFGSSRFMAPEEFELGALINERTTVFNLGRMISELYPGASDAIRETASTACEPLPKNRFASVGAFVRAWRTAIGSNDPQGNNGLQGNRAL